MDFAIQLITLVAKNCSTMVPCSTVFLRHRDTRVSRFITDFGPKQNSLKHLRSQNSVTNIAFFIFWNSVNMLVGNTNLTLTRFIYIFVNGCLLTALCMCCQPCLCAGCFAPRNVTSESSAACISSQTSSKNTILWETHKTQR